MSKTLTFNVKELLHQGHSLQEILDALEDAANEANIENELIKEAKIKQKEFDSKKADLLEKATESVKEYVDFVTKEDSKKDYITSYITGLGDSYKSIEDFEKLISRILK